MLEVHHQIAQVRARDDHLGPEALLRLAFFSLLGNDSPVDAQYIDSRRETVLGVAGLPFRAPVVSRLLADARVYRYLKGLWQDGQSVLIRYWPDGRSPAIFVASEVVRPVEHAPAWLLRQIAELLSSVSHWAGHLNERGEHIIDLESPAPGPHFFVNVLLGNRIGFPRPLQTTPKSVVDRLGRGSFRSHAGTQVLATRWDLLPEENGFPANRQFYLVENGEQIFYSANPLDSNVEWAQTVHSQNRTTIRYRTRCGLEIERVIFLLPQIDEMPPAVEVHSIKVTNRSEQRRQLKLIAVGMFGPAAPEALREDVVYTTLSLEARVFQRDDGTVAAVAPFYQPGWAQEDARFHCLVAHRAGSTFFPTEYCTSYTDFVGQGTLERPAGLRLLSNRLARKGPGFFALGVELDLPVGEEARVDNFTGLVSGRTDAGGGEQRLPEQVLALLNRFSDPEEVVRAMAASEAFLQSYTSHLRVHSGDADSDSYINNNLPFQILYQTFVSRSFDQTQKGYREIGFREVQDLMASLPFFIAMGKRDLARDLLREWASNIFEFGYAYHNFYWVGKEPGEFSDDALWFAQALDVYLNQTGDYGFLDEECPMAGANPVRTRSIYETLKAILRYSGQVSVGKHGLPLLDRADWNDTLRLDYDYLNGPQKEEAWQRQVEATGDPDQPLRSELSESVMNAFLLKVALDIARKIALQRGDTAYAGRLQQQTKALVSRIQEHAWKGDFFARVLFNRRIEGGYTYLGAAGDGLSDDPGIGGTYFLNSFSWAILADVATEDQIRTMLSTVKRFLWTPHGLKLCSPVRYRTITAKGGSGEYFTGDRENGGVFKHADMMAAVALLKGSREVTDRSLAKELRDLAYQVIDLVMPFRALRDPYRLAGNPRFCTQYNNSETGENVGPIVSGTASWLWLALMSAYGLKVQPDHIEFDPVLREEEQHLEIELKGADARYRFVIEKPRGFFRACDGQLALLIDGQPLKCNHIPRFSDGREHRVEACFRDASSALRPPSG